LSRSTRSCFWTLCGDGGDSHLLVCGVLVCDLDETALGEDVETQVAALLSPLVVLFGQDDADEPYQRGSIGEDADDVGASADSIEPFLGIVGRDLPPRRLRERGEGQDVGSGGVEVLRDGGSLSASASRIRSNGDRTASVSGRKPGATKP
jgi:hypothetical protein